jgi:hypothetical protein
MSPSNAFAPYGHAIRAALSRQREGAGRWDRDAACETTARYLPELVTLAKAVGPQNLPAFEEACEHTICLQCGRQNALGLCRYRDMDVCSLYHYLPHIYDAIHRADARGS